MRALILFTVIVLSLCAGWAAGWKGREKMEYQRMWDNPPTNTTCVVYPDGGKKCTPITPAMTIPFHECARICRQRARSM